MLLRVEDSALRMEENNSGLDASTKDALKGPSTADFVRGTAQKGASVTAKDAPTLWSKEEFV